MKNTNKKGLCLLFLMFISFALSANPLQTWDHDFNPALLSTGNREYVELGMSLDASLSNSYFTLQELFPEDNVLVLDFNEMADELNGKDLKFAASIDMEQHFVVTLLDVSVGQYVTVEGAVATAVPNNVIEVIADGISIGESNSDTGEIYAKVFATAGMYGGYRWKDKWQFSAKFGAFTPLIYSDGDANFSYSALNEDDGSLSASASMEIPLYSLFNMEDNEIDAGSIPEYLGYTMDFGAIRVIDDKPAYGFSLTGLTVASAVMPYTNTVTYSTSISTDNILDYVDDEDSLTEESEDVDIVTTEENYKVSMPLAIGGFYRLTGYPSFIDWIGTGEITLDDGSVYLASGITAEGNIFPLTALSLSLDYDKFFWETSMGLRFNVRVIEMGVDVGFSNTRFVKMFSPSGVTAGFYMGMGF
ncbi:MAG: hypothetical protein PQJ59_14875 [Spirochaetales bacterium]|nr:hypothetical protein [Spirochaetales bacterium]